MRPFPLFLSFFWISRWTSHTRVIYFSPFRHRLSFHTNSFVDLSLITVPTFSLHNLFPFLVFLSRGNFEFLRKIWKENILDFNQFSRILIFDFFFLFFCMKRDYKSKVYTFDFILIFNEILHTHIYIYTCNWYKFTKFNYQLFNVLIPFFYLSLLFPSRMI